MNSPCGLAASNRCFLLYSSADMTGASVSVFVSEPALSPLLQDQLSRLSVPQAGQAGPAGTGAKYTFPGRRGGGEFCHCCSACYTLSSAEWLRLERSFTSSSRLWRPLLGFQHPSPGGPRRAPDIVMLVLFRQRLQEEEEEGGILNKILSVCGSPP